jgi:hypothetical protein
MELILRAHQSVSNPSTKTTLLSEVQMRHAGHVVDSVHKDHLLSIDGTKGTQSLYLRHHTEDGEIIYKIPFLQRAGLMTFDHRKNLPIVMLSLDTTWDPRTHYDDHGALVIPPLDSASMAQSSLTTEQPRVAQHPRHLAHSSQLSSWHHSATYSVFQPQGAGGT